MRDLHNWPINPFDDPNIGINNLTKFGAHHLQRMTDNNADGFLAERITATTSALNAVNVAFENDQGSLGLRETMNQLKTEFRQTIPGAISKIYVALQAKYGEKAAQLNQFFPNGRAEFNHAGDDLMTKNLETLVTTLTAKQTEVGVEVVTNATALKTGWAAVYTPSKVSSSAKATSKIAKDNTRANLQLELFKNLLTISLKYPRQPEMVDVYMQQSLLQSHLPGSGTPTPPPSPTPTPTPSGLAAPVLDNDSDNDADRLTLSKTSQINQPDEWLGWKSNTGIGNPDTNPAEWNGPLGYDSDFSDNANWVIEWNNFTNNNYFIAAYRVGNTRSPYSNVVHP